MSLLLDSKREERIVEGKNKRVEIQSADNLRVYEKGFIPFPPGQVTHF